MVAASSDQHESVVGGDRRGCPAVASCRHPKAVYLRIHTIKTNRLTALIPRPSSGIVRRPAPRDRRVRSAGCDLIGEHHRKGSGAGAPTPRNPPVHSSFPPRPLPSAEPPPPVRRQAPHRRATTPQTRAHQGPPTSGTASRRTRENSGRAGLVVWFRETCAPLPPFARPTTVVDPSAPLPTDLVDADSTLGSWIGCGRLISPLSAPGSAGCIYARSGMAAGGG
jgi:hypothetical protein